MFPYTLYVGKDIRDASDLKGKKLAVSTVGGSGYVAAQYALRKLGLDPDKDVAMLQVGDFGTRLASLAAGTVQGTLLLPPFTLRAKISACGRSMIWSAAAFNTRSTRSPRANPLSSRSAKRLRIS